MNTQDQFFRAGDKVMRVAYASKIGFNGNGVIMQDTDFGRVLCVDSCWHDPAIGANLVSFVGVTPLPPFVGWVAACFRRIEEIQLCVRAAEKFKQNEEVEV